MFIETGAQSLAQIAANVVRIMQGNEQRFHDMWNPVLESINSMLPRGSGFDAGSKLDVDSSTESKLVFATSFHHMNECGMYDGWTEHNVIVTPSFSGISIRVTGRNRNDIKDYIAECFHGILSDYWKTSFDKDAQEMTIKPAQFDYGFNGPIVR